MNTLAEIILPDDMILDGLQKIQPVAASISRTLGGRLVIRDKAISSGFPIDLVADSNSGWISYGTVKQISSLQTIGCSMNLIFENKTYQVTFRWEDMPVIDCDFLTPRPNPEDGDLMFGRIKLLIL